MIFFFCGHIATAISHQVSYHSDEVAIFKNSRKKNCLKWPNRTRGLNIQIMCILCTLHKQHDNIPWEFCCWTCLYWPSLQAFSKVFNTTPDDLDMHVIYDVSHNIAKVEEHMVDGKQKTLLLHRKGSTRAFPPHHPLIPVDYQVI